MAVPDSAEPPAPERQLHDDLRVEYFEIADLVTGFDQRLLTIKGWGVTLSLASLGLGFQQEHYGLFLVAALSGLAFWVVEAVTKRHQMRFYPRMRDIEVLGYELSGVETRAGRASSPLLDWGWKAAAQQYGERNDLSLDQPSRFAPNPTTIWWGRLARRTRTIWFPHVAFPHAISVAAGLTLFALGVMDQLEGMPL